MRCDEVSAALSFTLLLFVVSTSRGGASVHMTLRSRAVLNELIDCAPQSVDGGGKIKGRNFAKKG
jgi:hypothetical protein